MYDSPQSLVLLPLATLLLVTALSSLCLSFLARHTGPQGRLAMQYHAGGLAMAAAGVVVLALQSLALLPPGWPMLAGHGALVSGALVMLAGSRRLCGQPPGWRITLFLAALFWIGFPLVHALSGRPAAESLFFRLVLCLTLLVAFFWRWTAGSESGEAPGEGRNSGSGNDRNSSTGTGWLLSRVPHPGLPGPLARLVALSLLPLLASSLLACLLLLPQVFPALARGLARGLAQIPALSPPLLSPSLVQTASLLADLPGWLSLALVPPLLVVLWQARGHSASHPGLDFMEEQSVFGAWQSENGLFTWVSQSCADLLGYHPAELTGRLSPLDVLVDEDRQRAALTIERRQRGELVEGLHYYTCRRKDGSTVPVVSQSRLVAGPRGPVLLGVIADRSAEMRVRQLAREARELLHGVLNQPGLPALSDFPLQPGRLQPGPALSGTFFSGTFFSGEDGRHEPPRLQEARALAALAGHSSLALALADSSGCLTSVNPAMATLLGRPAEQLTGQPLPFESPLSPCLYSVSQRGTPWQGTLCHPGPDGENRWLAVEALALDSAPATFALLAIDITDRIDDARREDNARQQEQVTSLGRLDLLINTSHELRTPLNAILGFSDLICNEVFGPVNNDRYRDYVSDIHASATHLLALVNDLLDSAAIENGQLALNESWVATRPLVSSSLRLLLPRCIEAGITLSTDIEPEDMMLLVDERRFRQILINLAANAVRYTPAGGEISVQAGILPDGQACLSVSDNGCGMDAAGIEQALRRFGRVGRQSGEGTGLGLPLSADLVALHQGNLRLSSAPGRGTTVQVILPAARVQGQPPRIPRNRPQGATVMAFPSAVRTSAGASPAREAR